MKANLQTLAVPVAIAAILLTGCSTMLKITDRTDPTRPSVVQSQEGYDTFGRKWEVLSRSESMLLTFAGTITDIDYATREMTLKSPEGRLETFVVDKTVQRFSEARVGDNVSLGYYLGIDAEVRPPTNEEKAKPLEVLDAAKVRTGAYEAPAGYDMQRVRAVVTIEALDKSDQTVTVKGPRGKYFTTRVADPSRLDKVRVGETILMTFTQATAVSLKPEVMKRSQKCPV